VSLADFASVVSTLRANRETGDAAVVAVIVRNDSSLQVRPAQRIVVSERGEVTGSFPDQMVSQLRADALTCLSDRRSRLLSYSVADSELARVGPQQGEIDVYFELLERPPRLVVVGGGHIAVPLVRIAAVLGYDVSVVEDRAEYADPARFPDAHSVLHGPYRETLASIPLDANTYVVLVTRGHVHDAACLADVIDSSATYIGMIGSRKRVRTVIDHVLGPQPSTEVLQRIYAPIGIDIGSTSPEEIAVAIAAELIKVRRGGKAASLRLQDRTRV
jgi:xanthine dehydrogenase accessory factor